MSDLINSADYLGEATVGDKYQIVMVKSVRKIAKRLKPGTKVVIMPIDESSVNISVKNKDWIEECYGMDKGLWDKDATKLIRELRDKEWK